MHFLRFSLINKNGEWIIQLLVSPINCTFEIPPQKSTLAWNPALFPAMHVGKQNQWRLQRISTRIPLMHTTRNLTSIPSFKISTVTPIFSFIFSIVGLVASMYWSFLNFQLTILSPAMLLRPNQPPPRKESAAVSRGRRLISRMKLETMMGPCPTRSTLKNWGKASLLYSVFQCYLKWETVVYAMLSSYALATF